MTTLYSGDGYSIDGYFGVIPVASTTGIASILTDMQTAFSTAIAEFGYPIKVIGLSSPILALLGFKLSALDSTPLGTFNVVQTRKYTFIINASDYWSAPALFTADNTFTLFDGITTFTFIINVDAVPNPMQQFQFEANISGFAQV